MTQPLASYRVVELPGLMAPVVHRLGLSLAGRIAADLGAEVTRVEPQPNDPIHAIPVLPWEDDMPPSALHSFLDSKKRVIHADPANIDERSRADELISNADIILTDDSLNWTDVGLDDLEDKVVCRLSAFPGKCAFDDGPVSELTLLALSGMLDVVGDPTREPLMLGGHQASYAGGLAMYSAMMTGLAARQSQGIGDFYDVDLLSVLSWVNWKGVCGSLFGPKMEATREGADAEWRVVRAKDGWMALVFNQGDWPSITDLVGAPQLKDPQLATRSGRAKHRDAYMPIIEGWFAERTRDEIYHKSQALRIPIGPVVELDELPDDPQIAHRSTVERQTNGEGEEYISPVLPVLWDGKTISPGGGEKAVSPEPGRKKKAAGKGNIPSGRQLEDLLVLDLGMITAGAATSALLADAGAEVIKIESPTRPDPFRNWSSETANGDATTSPFFEFTNRNKHGLAVDLKRAEGRALFLSLVEKADVVVENFRRGVMQNLGISYDELRKVNPRIVLASISSQGETGPDCSYSSYGSTLEATGGLAAMTGYPGGPPVITGRNVNYPDQIVSLFAMGTIVAAVMEARRTGTGAHLDISQREVTMFLVGEAVTAANTTAQDGGNVRRGNADPGGRPQITAKSKDGAWVVATLLDESVEAGVVALLGSGAAHKDIVDAVTAWIGSQSAEEAVEQLRNVGAAVARVLTGSEVLDAMRDSGPSLAKNPDGRVVKGFPFQSRRRPFSIHTHAPLVGQDTEQVLRHRLGMSEATIADLLKDGVVAGN